jgi:hypothetical protein
VTSIAVDSQNRKWIGTLKSGLWCYDGVSWKNYTEYSGSLDNRILDLVIDKEDVKWIVFSGYRKLLSLHGSDWKGYDSGTMPYLQILAMTVGPDNVKWFGSYDDGVVSLVTDFQIPTRASTTNPESFSLNGSYPNPFNASTLIRFSLDRKAFTEIRIYNSAGQQVRRLINEVMSPGEHRACWNGKNDQGKNLASGFYIARLYSQGQSRSIKLMLLK